MLGEGVAAEGEGEGEKDFDLVGFYAAHKLRGAEGKGYAEEETSAGLDEKKQADMAEGGRLAAGGFENCEEENRTDAVVEEGLSG